MEKMAQYSDERCKVTYQGPSYPEFHGTACVLRAHHAGRHYSDLVGGESKGPLSWWTAEEKRKLEASWGNQ